MAEISPFRGLLYGETAGNAADLLAPPYDVIDDDARAQLAARNPHNCVHLILPEGEGSDRYDLARDRLHSWIASGILARDAEPCIYLYHQVYRHPALGPDEVTRRGFIAAVRLADFDERVVRRHERTLAGPKLDRLRLWETTGCHLSQIFALYRDPDAAVDGALAGLDSGVPAIDAETDDGTRHLLWRVSDAAVIARVREALAERPLYIADGHHRYETMLALRNRAREAAGGQLPDNAASEFGMMFLARASDPGLVVLPTHRLIHGLDSFDRRGFLAEIDKHFAVETATGAGGSAARLLAAIAGSGRPRFGVVFPGSDDLTVITARPSLDLADLGVDDVPSVRVLDVAVLHELILDRILGIDRERQEAKLNIEYLKDTESAIEAAQSARGQLTFFMNATPVQQVLDVSDDDGVMPQKSTFFYPKIASGLVFSPASADERL